MVSFAQRADRIDVRDQLGGVYGCGKVALARKRALALGFVLWGHGCGRPSGLSGSAIRARWSDLTRLLAGSSFYSLGRSASRPPPSCQQVADLPVGEYHQQDQALYAGVPVPIWCTTAGMDPPELSAEQKKYLRLLAAAFKERDEGRAAELIRKSGEALVAGIRAKSQVSPNNSRFAYHRVPRRVPKVVL